MIPLCCSHIPVYTCKHGRRSNRTPGTRKKYNGKSTCSLLGYWLLWRDTWPGRAILRHTDCCRPSHQWLPVYTSHTFTRKSGLLVFTVSHCNHLIFKYHSQWRSCTRVLCRVLCRRSTGRRSPSCPPEPSARWGTSTSPLRRRSEPARMYDRTRFNLNPNNRSMPLTLDQ